MIELSGYQQNVVIVVFFKKISSAFKKATSLFCENKKSLKSSQDTHERINKICNNSNLTNVWGYNNWRLKVLIRSKTISMILLTLFTSFALPYAPPFNFVKMIKIRKITLVRLSRNFCMLWWVLVILLKVITRWTTVSSSYFTMSFATSIHDRYHLLHLFRNRSYSRFPRSYFF
jgi:hypothetical protein